MNTPRGAEVGTELGQALSSEDSSARLQTALSAGTHPDPGDVEALVDRCAIEPDFYVRDMLSWALTRLPASVTVPRLLEETRAAGGQARSQALHTLSKIGDPRGWAAVTPELLHDADDEVARSAWRAAVVLVPAGAEERLAGALAAELGRGGRDVQLSLSRALVALGDAAVPVLAEAAHHGNATVRVHAIATERLRRDPEAGFDAAIFEAKRVVALGNAPTGTEGSC